MEKFNQSSIDLQRAMARLQTRPADLRAQWMAEAAEMVLRQAK